MLAFLWTKEVGAILAAAPISVILAGYLAYRLYKKHTQKGKEKSYVG